MFGRWIDKGYGPIGLDLGSQTVRLVQLARRPGSGGGAAPYRVVAARARRWPADLPAQGPERTEAVAAVLREMLETGGFKGRRVVSCLPASAVQYRNLRLPKMPRAEMRTAVEWEATGRMNLAEGGQVSVQYFDAGDVWQGEEARREIILLAAPAGLVDEHLRLLQGCNLSPIAIDAVPGALARAAAWNQAAPGEGAAEARFVLEVGYTSTKALIVRQGEVIFFKLIDIGGQKFDQAVAGRLQIPLGDAAELRQQLRPKAGASTGPESPLFGAGRRENVERAVAEALRAAASDLAREVGLCLRYYAVTFRGRRPDQAVLAGGGAIEPQLIKALADDAGLSVEPWNILAGVDASGAAEIHGDPNPGGWAAALGLALRFSEAVTRRQAA
jgi:type IV pilus assembly protein PilM